MHRSALIAKNSRRHHGIHRRHNLYFFFRNYRLLLLATDVANRTTVAATCRRAVAQIEPPLATITGQ